MQYLLAEQGAGDLTVKEFCKKHQLSQAALYYWQKKLKGQKSGELSSVGFKEIAVSAGSSAFSSSLCYSRFAAALHASGFFCAHSAVLISPLLSHIS